MTDEEDAVAHDSYDLVSFDVFDTLLLRAIDRPTDVFRIVRAKLVGTPTALFEPAVVDSFPQLRVRAERLARDRKLRDHGSDEVTLDEIYACLGRLTDCSAEALALLRRTELATEAGLVYPNPAAAARLRAERARGKRVVLCSDMYLPSKTIRSLLHSCGYDDEVLYLSCELGVSKHHGTMFGHVARAEGVAPGRILHIGDNACGDVKMAADAGCQALHLTRPEPRATSESPWAGDSQAAAAVSAVVNGLLLRRQELGRGGVADPLEELGHRVFGPLFIGFLIWLRQTVLRKPPDRVLLFARDANWLVSMLPRVLADAGLSTDIRYVYVSRAALLMPGMTDFSMERLGHLFSGRVPRTVRDHLRRLGLDPETVAAAISRAGFDSGDELVSNGDRRMHDLLGALHGALLRESVHRRPIVQEYLEPFVSGANDVMLVDVGWVGNMQASLLRLVGPAHPRLRVRGHYVGVFSSASGNQVAGHPMHGWLTRPGDPEQLETNMWWAGGVEILEFAMRAQHGTTLGYEHMSDGTVAPRLEADARETALSALAARLQRGATAFVEDFLASYGSDAANGLDSRAWAAPFHRLVTAPTPCEAALLGDVGHSDIAGASERFVALAPAADLPSERPATFERCHWKMGFVVRNGLDVEASFDEAFYLHLHPDVREAVAAGTFLDGREHWLGFGRQEERMCSWAAWARQQRDAAA